MNGPDGTSPPTIRWDSIPAEMRERRQWVVWKYRRRKGKPTKVPFVAGGPGPAESDDPTTWRSFDEARSAFESGKYDGVGYMFTKPRTTKEGVVIKDEDPYTGVDLDKCRDPATGDVAREARGVIDLLNSYTEVSPSGTGAHVIVRATLPGGLGRRMPAAGFDHLEVYDRGRYFAMTGDVVPGTPTVIEERQAEVEEIVAKFTNPDNPSPPGNGPEPPEDARPNGLPPRVAALLGGDDKFAARWRGSTEGLKDTSRSGVAHSLVCKMLHAHIPRADIDAALRVWSERVAYDRPSDPRWRETTISNAERFVADRAQQDRAQGPGGDGPDDDTDIEPTGAARLLAEHPNLPAPVIHGIARRGEIVNLVSAPKIGKTWTALDLALCVCTGADWLDTFRVVPGPVLYLNYELPSAVFAHRLRELLRAKHLAEPPPDLDILNLRGRDFSAARLFAWLRRRGRRYSLIIVDPLYRAYPDDFDENKNADMARLYGILNRCASVSDAAILVVHHQSKGGQSDKEASDVGAGAGAQSRAADSHVIMRRHEQDNAVVLEALTRSWAPSNPLCLRWTFPLWSPAPDLDATALKRAKPPDRRKNGGGVNWTPQMFAQRFITDTPRKRTAIIAQAREQAEMSASHAEGLMDRAIEAGAAFEHQVARNKPVMVSTRKESLLESQAA